MFYECFIALCNENGVKPSTVAKAIGLSNAAPTYWKNGSIPKASTIQAIADYFGVTIDSLLDKENLRLFDLIPNPGGLSPSDHHDILDDIDMAFYGEYKELSEEDKETLRAMARLFYERKKNKKPPQD